MCRLLAAVSPTAQPLTATLGQELAPFRELARVHCDGWGIAYWDDQDNLEVAKAPEAALDSAAFAQAVDTATTDAAILHLRKASAGMANLEQNTHPFVAGSMAFAHNGWVHPAEAVEEVLRSHQTPAPSGDTDSERYFALVRSFMSECGPVEALDRAICALAGGAQYLSLNCLLLTHDGLYAATRWNAAAVAAKGDDPDTFTLRFRARAGSVLVASSGWEQAAPDWEVLGNGQLLEVPRHTLRPTVHRLSAIGDHG